ncbi:MAG: hypothetical protein SF069_14590 [Phycisphaerae bacterium]|jgi:hypothetical protein|nr:hypothetical protein [Phycisphaerae bacterium]
MFHLCAFGGNGGELPTGWQCYLTMFGASEITRPTLVKQILAQQASGDAGKQQKTHAVFLTVFGGVDVTVPTLATEFAELHAAVSSRAITLDHAERLAATATPTFSTSRITLFGGCDTENLPSEDDEIEGLAHLRSIGLLNERGERQLLMAIGQKGVQRLYAVCAALRAMAG